ncbi:hydroxyacylglutathione hydrolase [Agrobacterium sp. SHOUNA12C]|uniref:Hydroxyacylglutathione hydrolase n=2 Tax=Rhizobium rhizogenes TaxID=359 RepID=B9JBS3_RHIR8|nr:MULTISPECIES: hydroxyacylglutathione hydrolase [Rhizobium]ACM27969.1 hydroxyacylgluthatione hydrolase protein [Rhizobium rhizogenes K84]KAA6485672.1 hydroxyacylglutathione hydrolase [Agrobacterium sp. ICMP 7243]MCJ9723777.1 hydroxyacylglutathione hydrolase [Agrobacterium sp. BETTINA12B]MCJ9760779.1 hydroxyacylglutathione hydrolase [Agrobacterium sp. SHOUNA12C]OCJ08977.1 hydroxyacylglutathione hydrolase [Agrobacterium sp. B131/95]OCJ14364.1 hydroxyacylglutathione hydrolase [Agrobacterium sp
MKPLELEVFLCRSDNFGVLVHDPETGYTASIDAPEAGPILAAAKRRGWTITHILTTHHHTDHVDANLALKEQFGCEIIGPIGEAVAIPGLDRAYGDGDSFEFGNHTVDVIETPGHTAGHICYHFVDDKLLFAADTLFALGCGRLFERPAMDMWASLQKLAVLPDETAIYFGHEYTLSNARFALTIDPDNERLKSRAADIEALRAAGKFTIPTTLALEKETNPFLRAADPSIRRHLLMESRSNEEVFTEIRKRKDNF